MNSIGVQSADIVIEPDVAGVDLSEFSKTNELAIAGEQAARESMPRLRSLLSKLDDRLFQLT